jgi:glycosyltransferase involved in cell wall biosynthesis
MEEEVDSVCLAEYGILTPVADEDFMASAIDTLSSDIALRNSYEFSAKERANDFSVDKIVQQYKSELLGQLYPGRGDALSPPSMVDIR